MYSFGRSVIIEQTEGAAVPLRPSNCRLRCGLPLGGNTYDEEIHFWHRSGFHRSCGWRAALYLRRREKELDEYESLLYADSDFDEDDDETTYAPISPEAPAGDADGVQDDAAQS